MFSTLLLIAGIVGVHHPGAGIFIMVVAIYFF
jgi:hypothetical protein